MASKITTDHAEIRRWVEARGGCPAHVKKTGRKRADPGILRIDYEGFSGVDTLEEIDWDDWFAAFDANKLAFLYDTDKKSRFSKLIARSTASRASRSSTRGTKRASAAASKRPAAKRTATARTSPKKRTTAKKRTTTAKRRSTSARAR